MAYIWFCSVTWRLFWIVWTNKLFRKLILSYFRLTSILCFNVCKKWSLRSLLNLLIFSICCLESIILIKLVIYSFRTLSNIKILISLSSTFRSSSLQVSLFTCRSSSFENTHIIQKACISIKAIKQEILLLKGRAIN